MTRIESQYPGWIYKKVDGTKQQKIGKEIVQKILEKIKESYDIKQGSEEEVLKLIGSKIQDFDIDGNFDFNIKEIMEELKNKGLISLKKTQSTQETPNLPQEPDLSIALILDDDNKFAGFDEATPSQSYAVLETKKFGSRRISLGDMIPYGKFVNFDAPERPGEWFEQLQAIDDFFVENKEMLVRLGVNKVVLEEIYDHVIDERIEISVDKEAKVLRLKISDTVLDEGPEYIKQALSDHFYVGENFSTVGVKFDDYNDSDIPKGKMVDIYKDFNMVCKDLRVIYPDFNFILEKVIDNSDYIGEIPVEGKNENNTVKITIKDYILKEDVEKIKSEFAKAVFGFISGLSHTEIETMALSIQKETTPEFTYKIDAANNKVIINVSKLPIGTRIYYIAGEKETITFAEEANANEIAIKEKEDEKEFQIEWDGATKFTLFTAVPENNAYKTILGKKEAD